MPATITNSFANAYHEKSITVLRRSSVLMVLPALTQNSSMLPSHVLWTGMIKHKAFRHFVLPASEGHWGNYIAHVLETLLAGGLSEMLASVRQLYFPGGAIHVALQGYRATNHV